MKRLATATAAAVVLAVVVLGAPGVVGSTTEARVRERVAAIDASDTASAELTSFERGWFRSTAKIELRFAPDDLQFAFDDAETGLAAGILPIHVDFAHGPVAVLDGVSFGWSKLVARLDTEAPGVVELERTLGVPYVFEFRGRTGFFGGLDFDADAPPFELPIDETLVTFSGAMLDGTFADPRLTANAHVAAVAFASSTGTFAIHNLRAGVDNELRSPYVMPGEATFSIERVAIGETGSAVPLFEAANLRVASITGLDTAGELLEMRVDYDLDSVRIEQSEVTAAKLGMAMRNLDAAALEAYGAALEDAAGTVSAPGELLATFAPQLERALRAGPSLTIDPISFELDAEPFEGRIAVSTNTARLPSTGALNLDNPLLVLGLFDTDAEVRLSKVLAQRLAMLFSQMQLAGDGATPPEQLEYMAEAQSGLLLTMLVAQGVLVEDGDGYASALQITNGALTLNGSVLPIGLP
ncbi:MAG TPA: DUF945 family protein [Gammaproteobacteria bacterium]|nr:DUF945 family protein [Gammaproteobacteria bacterium]